MAIRIDEYGHIIRDSEPAPSRHVVPDNEPVPSRHIIRDNEPAPRRRIAHTRRRRRGRHINAGTVPKVLMITFVIAATVFVSVVIYRHLRYIEDTPVVSTAEIDQTDQDSGFVFPNSDTELINQEALGELSNHHLQYAINEIYARHGYIFQTNEVREYYEQFSWYSGCIPANIFSVDCFNQIELQNWQMLCNERDRRK